MAADKSLQVEKSVARMNQTEKSDYLEELVYKHATTDRELACEAYRILGKEREIPLQVTEFLAATLTDNDPEEALGWLEELPPGANRRAGYSQLCSKLAEDSPMHAADLATKTIPLDVESTALFTQISGAWAKTEPLSAADWTGRFPEGSARYSALLAVFRSWNKSDAERWILGIKEPSLRKDALTAKNSAFPENESPTSSSFR